MITQNTPVQALPTCECQTRAVEVGLDVDTTNAAGHALQDDSKVVVHTHIEVRCAMCGAPYRTPKDLPSDPSPGA